MSVTVCGIDTTYGGTMNHASDFMHGRAALGILILRVVGGYALMVHGSIHLQAPWQWMGQTAAPSIVQALTAGAEFTGGLAILLGILTPVAALAILLSMITTLMAVHLPHGDPFVATPTHRGSNELAYLYSAMSLLFMMLGPGSISLDAVLFQRKRAIKTSYRQRKLVMLR